MTFARALTSVTASCLYANGAPIILATQTIVMSAMAALGASECPYIAAVLLPTCCMAASVAAVWLWKQAFAAISSRLAGGSNRLTNKFINDDSTCAMIVNLCLVTPLCVWIAAWSNDAVVSATLFASMWEPLVLARSLVPMFVRPSMCHALLPHGHPKLRSAAVGWLSAAGPCRSWAQVTRPTILVAAANAPPALVAFVPTANWPIPAAALPTPAAPTGAWIQNVNAKVLNGYTPCAFGFTWAMLLIGTAHSMSSISLLGLACASLIYTAVPWIDAHRHQAVVGLWPLLFIATSAACDVLVCVAPAVALARDPAHLVMPAVTTVVVPALFGALLDVWWLSKPHRLETTHKALKWNAAWRSWRSAAMFALLLLVAG